jgi:hypothetical protein
MAISPLSIRVGTCYLFEPGGRIFRVEAITPDDKIHYRLKSKTDGIGSSDMRTSMGRERFAQDAVGEVPCGGSVTT